MISMARPRLRIWGSGVRISSGAPSLSSSLVSAFGRPFCKICFHDVLKLCDGEIHLRSSSWTAACIRLVEARRDGGFFRIAVASKIQLNLKRRTHGFGLTSPRGKMPNARNTGTGPYLTPISTPPKLMMRGPAGSKTIVQPHRRFIPLNPNSTQPQQSIV
jgi:hypothetical protein